MRKETSLYLDMLRILAVLMVFFSHTKRAEVSGGVLPALGAFGDTGVMIFFVLSGVVISHVLHARPQGFATYVQGRLARLWSVALPAMVLTVVLDVAGRQIHPATYASPELPPPWAWNLQSLTAAVAPLLFVNQAFGWAIDPGTNGPFWSLCYEFWYYLTYGVLWFCRGWTRLFWLALLAGVMGLKILTLLPIWLLGTLVYRYVRAGRRGTAAEAWAWVLSCLVLAALLLLRYRIYRHLQVSPASPTVQLAERYVVAGLVALNLLLFSRIDWLMQPVAARLSAPVLYLAQRSFSAYLYQAPLLFFLGAVTSGIGPPALRWALVVGSAWAAILVLARHTELQKPRYAKAIARGWTWVGRHAR